MRQYLQTVRLKHLRARPHHPQTNVNIEHMHRTLKEDVMLVVYTGPDHLREAAPRWHECTTVKRLRAQSVVEPASPGDVCYQPREDNG